MDRHTQTCVPQVVYFTAQQPDLWPGLSSTNWDCTVEMGRYQFFKIDTVRYAEIDGVTACYY